MALILVLFWLLILGEPQASAANTAACLPLYNPFGQLIGVECTWSEEATTNHCPDRMERAMRAREEWATLTDESSRWNTVTSASLSITNETFYAFPYSDNNVLKYSPDTRTEEERLADEFEALDARKQALAERRVKEAKEKEAKRLKDARIAVLKQQWEDGKSCWSKP